MGVLVGVGGWAAYDITTKEIVDYNRIQQAGENRKLMYIFYNNVGKGVDFSQLTISNPLRM